MATMRPADVIARYGGEEFALLLPETELEQATMLAEKCRSMIVDQKIVFSEGVSNVVTISLGVSSSIPELGTSPSELVEAADKALYRAKDSGRNRVISS
jgi:diguanylate cyclase (GGDEF)-like protein